MYQTGDLIVYGGTGVCRVDGVRSMAPAGGGEAQEYYVLKPVFQNCTISTPVDNPKVFMRPVISREEADALIDAIPDIQAEEFHSAVSRELRDHYEAAFKTHDCRALVELTMSIHTKKQNREQIKRRIGAVDERYMRRAEELLFGELAVALEISREEVPAYIAKRIEGK